MSPTLKKTLAVLMVCVTSLGILLCLFFLVLTWRIRQPATVKLHTALIQTSSILQTTVVGLDVIDQVVTNVYSSTLYLNDATVALSQTIETTGQFIDAAGSFVGVDLNNTISNTQKTLESAQSSALVIDNILTTLSSVPLIGINYNPSEPLSSALGKVSASLDPLQESLTSFQDNLTATRTNMQTFTDQLKLMSQNITNINQNLAASQEVIDNYRIQVTSLKSWVDNAVTSLPTWVTTTCVVISFFILLLILVQAAILLQAIYLLKGPGTDINKTNEPKPDYPLPG
jgi:methyl-accepting chemotaxis protein